MNKDHNMAIEDSSCGNAEGKGEAQARLDTELEILHAMYADGQLSYSFRGREVHFHNELATEGTQSSSRTGSLVLRLPELYPVSGLPEVLSASNGHRDLREETRQALSNLGVSEGEEMIDALILAFQDLVQSATSNGGNTTQTTPEEEEDKEESWSYKPPLQNEYKTVIIWLHHLLNTNKRKLALNPEISSSVSSQQSSKTSKSRSHATLASSPATTRKQTIISGFSKPGYPGILIFSGPRDLVASHVSALRAQRWQAFQVRYDSDEDALPTSTSNSTTNSTGGGESWPPPGLWEFDDVATGLEVVFEARSGSAGGSAVQEVESISVVAKHIRDQRCREVFSAAIGVK